MDDNSESTIMRHFVTDSPREKQIVALQYIEKKFAEGYRDIVISAPTGCHAKGQKLLMFEGYLKAVEDIVVGDILVGPNLGRRNVLRLIRGRGPMHKITPEFGKSFVVNDQHVLNLKRLDALGIADRNTVNITVADYLTSTVECTARLRLWRIRPASNNIMCLTFSVTPCGEDDFYGFTLDKDQLYLLDDFTVTHNSGKTFISSTCCFWSQDLDIEGASGGFVLTAQKMLQDQIENDIPRYRVHNASGRCRSLKSAIEYPCPTHGNCASGLSSRPACKCAPNGNCAYMRTKEAWMNATMAVTNYPYLFTEHQFCGKIAPRKVLVLDEAHAIERQILGFVEIAVNQEHIDKFTPHVKRVPKLHRLEDFIRWMTTIHMPMLLNKKEDMAGWTPTDDSPSDAAMAKEKAEFEAYYGRLEYGMTLLTADPSNWVFSQELNKKGELNTSAKPLNAAPFAQKILLEMGAVRIYLSAYMGSKGLFCRSLGLDHEKVAWLNLSSTFPVEHRPIILSTVGSMSKNNRPATLPYFFRFVQKILDKHSDTKGLIHSASYELAELIYDTLGKTEHRDRLIFPKSAAERDDAFEKHKDSPDPTIIISPSMTEGFDFMEDFARWQIIAKVNYPYLGDKQVLGKKELDPQWYDLEAVKSIIQASGRICRSEEDIGITYILDSDFLDLYSRNEDMFPKWWKEACVWPKRKATQ